MTVAVPQSLRRPAGVIDLAAHLHAKATATTQALLLAAYRDIPVEALGGLLTLATAPGWALRWIGGDALIFRARSVLLTQWLDAGAADGGDVCLWVDADMLYDPVQAGAMVAKCRASYPLLGGGYAVRDGTKLAQRLLPGHSVGFDDQGDPDAEPVPVRYLATGFMAIRRDVVADVAGSLTRTAEGYYPFFLPSVADGGDLLSEDYAFCARAAAAGYQPHIDPGVWLRHLGTKAYTVADIKGGTPDGSG